MIRATRIGHVHLNVRDLDRAERFYTEIIGFQVQERIPGKFVFLALGKRHHDLALRFIGTGTPVPPELSVGMYHFAVEVEDMASLARALRRLKDAGVPVGGSNHGGSLALDFRDPEGTEVEYYVDTRNQKGEFLTSPPAPLDEETLLAHLEEMNK